LIDKNKNDSILSSPPEPIVIPIIGATLFRLVLNTARRFAYPFAPVLSRGLGVSLSSVTSLIAINQLTALLGVLMGPLTDRLGYRKMMIAGMALLGLGMTSAAIFPIYAVVMMALLLSGVGKTIFDPAVQAWAGSRVPFHRRGLVIGLLETSWSASTLIGIPATAFLIDRYGWRSPFLVMGILGCLGAVILFYIVPEAPARNRSSPSHRHYLDAYRQLVSSRPALGALACACFISAANDNLFVVYGAWLEKSFGLGIVALGLGTGLIGVAELLGEGLTATLADRFGLKRAVLTGLGLTAGSYFLLPWLDASLPAALVGLMILFLSFEFTMVTSITLCTELLPSLRATMMAGFFALAGIGRVIGALMGAVVWQSGGIVATGWVSGTLTLLAMICLAGGLKGWRWTDS
jgi:DHA1 family inner membrane transport protein